MTEPQRFRAGRRIATYAYVVGLLLLALLAFLSAWPDLEASVFDSATSASAGARLRSLRCPLAISADESATVRAAFANRSDRPVGFLVRARISEGFVTLVRQDTQQVHLAPGEEIELAWPVSATDAAYGRVVLARVLATRSAGQPARDAACGILVLGITGIRGAHAFAIGAAFAAGLLVVGGWYWRAAHSPLRERDRSTAMLATTLTSIVVASLATGVLGWWLVSHLLLVAAVLFLMALLYRASTG